MPISRGATGGGSGPSPRAGRKPRIPLGTAIAEAPTTASVWSARTTRKAAVPSHTITTPRRASTEEDDGAKPDNSRPGSSSGEPRDSAEGTAPHVPAPPPKDHYVSLRALHRYQEETDEELLRADTLQAAMEPKPQGFLFKYYTPANPEEARKRLNPNGPPKAPLEVLFGSTLNKTNDGKPKKAPTLPPLSITRQGAKGSPRALTMRISPGRAPRSPTEDLKPTQSPGHNETGVAEEGPLSHSTRSGDHNSANAFQGKWWEDERYSEGIRTRGAKLAEARERATEAVSDIVYNADGHFMANPHQDFTFLFDATVTADCDGTETMREILSRTKVIDSASLDAQLSPQLRATLTGSEDEEDRLFMLHRRDRNRLRRVQTIMLESFQRHFDTIEAEIREDAGAEHY